MGNPVQFAIVRDGKLDVFYGHWGAVSVARDIFWGPDATTPFIRRHEAVEGLSEGMEAIVLLDADAKVAFCWNDHSWLDPESQESEAFVPLLEAVWRRSGWRVSIARSAAKVADAAGVPIAEEPRGTPGRRVERFDHAGWNFATLITVARGDGVVDRVVPSLDDRWQSSLLHLVSLVRRATKLVSLESAIAGDADREPKRFGLASRLQSAVHADVRAKTMLIHAPRALVGLQKHVRDRAEGFRVDFHEGGWERHFAASGRPVPAFLARAVPLRQGVAKALDLHFKDIAQRLFRSRSFGAEVQELVSKEGWEPLGGAALPVPGVNVRAAERLAILEAALRDVAPASAERLTAVARQLLH